MPTTYYIEAFDGGDMRILGNCDGQNVLHCKRPELTTAVKRLKSGLNRPKFVRVAYWKITKKGFSEAIKIPNIHYIAPRRKFEPTCAYCQSQTSPAGFFPPHDPSPRCQSGGRPHCTCDTCF